MNQDRVQQPIGEYVVGYCFREGFDAVVLIEKRKPAWQAGKLNGVGGKVELREPPYRAMVREFEEEAGVCITSWLHIRTEQFDNGTGARVHHFACCIPADDFARVTTMEKEPIVKVQYPLGENTRKRVIYNLPYLIPMGAILLQQPPENRPIQ